MSDAASFNGQNVSDLMPGRLQVLAEASTANTGVGAWVRLDVPRPCILMPASGQRLVRYYAAAPSEQTILQNLAYNAWDGICYLIRPGWGGPSVWWVNVPTDGTPGNVNFILKDAISVVMAGALAAGTTTPGAGPAAVAGAPAAAAPSTSSVSILAAAPSRREVYIKNTSTAAQRVSLAFGQAAVLDSGITLAAGDSIIIDTSDGLAPLEIRAIASALASLALQVVS